MDARMFDAEAVAPLHDEAAGTRPVLDGRRFDVGGRALHAVCAGPPHRPAVVFEAGPFGIAADWAVVQGRLARARLTLSYDRAGLGASDPGPAPRDSAAVVDDLQALLAAANLRGPYVLVAASVAAFHAQLFALRRPEVVSGLVLVDPVPPEAMLDRRVAERVRGSEFRAGFAPAAARLGLLRMADPLAGDPIGLPPAAAAAKREAFASERHNAASLAEAREWLFDAESARDAGELSRELPVAVITVGGGDAAVREILQAPARRSRRGYLAHVEGANGATILGARHAEAVVRAVEHVVRFSELQPAPPPV